MNDEVFSEEEVDVSVTIPLRILRLLNRKLTSSQYVIAKRYSLKALTDFTTGIY